MKANTKKLFIKTWGCQMNVYDSNKMADILAPMGYRQSDTPEDADMIILNTCHIREKATDKVFSELGRLKIHKDKKERNGEKMIMAVAGCVAQAEGDFIAERAPYVDMVFGPQTYGSLPEMIAEATGAYGRNRVINTDFPAETKFDKLPEETLSKGATAFLAVQEGCDKFCTFCVVPYTRGAEYSRSVGAVMDEARALRDGGVSEIILIGQNVNAYHGLDENSKTRSLADMIAMLADMEGIERIRYTTSHPRDMDDGLIDAHGSIAKLMPYLHLPVQSGSNKILKAMNRKHEVKLYLDIIENLRKKRPDIAMSGDFIVGFPGETEQDFEETMQLVRTVNYAQAYSFKYSARPGTPAATMGGLVREESKTERLARLQSLLMEQQLAFNTASIGREMDVLFDGRGRHKGQLHARTPYNQAIHIMGNERLLGTIHKAVVTGTNGNSLTGDLTLIEDDCKLAS